MNVSIPPDKRAEWREWAEQEVGGDDGAVDAATDAVLAALLRGHSVEEAMDAGRTAATSGSSSDRGPAVEATATAVHPVSDRDHLRGQVSAFRQRNELMGSRYGSVWDFRVDSWDASGQTRPAVAVEIRAVEIVGSIGDGDWVEIEAQPKPGKVLHVSRLHNISMNAEVTGKGGASSGRAARVIKTVFGVVVTLIVLVIGLAIFAGVAARMDGFS